VRRRSLCNIAHVSRSSYDALALSNWNTGVGNRPGHNAAGAWTLALFGVCCGVPAIPAETGLIARPCDKLAARGPTRCDRLEYGPVRYELE
jgi:hypothetical protein